MFAEEMLSPLVHHFLFDAHCMWTWCLPCHNYTSYFRTIVDRPLSVCCGMFSFSKDEALSTYIECLLSLRICTSQCIYSSNMCTTLIYSLDWSKKRQFMYWSINKLCLTTALHNSPTLIIIIIFFTIIVIVFLNTYLGSCCFWKLASLFPLWIV